MNYMTRGKNGKIGYGMIGYTLSDIYKYQGLLQHMQNKKADLKMIKEAKFISVWDGGERIETACKVNTDTREVFDIEKSNYTPDGICEGEYVEIDRKKYLIL